MTLMRCTASPARCVQTIASRTSFSTPTSFMTPRAAVDVHAQVGDALDDVRREIHEQDVVLHVAVRTLFEVTRGAHDVGAQRFGEHVHLGEFELNGLVLDDVFTALPARSRLVHRHVDRRLAHAPARWRRVPDRRIRTYRPFSPESPGSPRPPRWRAARGRPRK